MKRRLARALVGSLYGLFAAADLIQLIQAARGWHPDPPGLLVTHGVTGLLAGFAVVGIWSKRPWAVWAVLGWGAVTAGMLLVLGPLIQEPREEWPGFWIAAGVVVLFCLAVAYGVSPRRTRG